MSFAPGLLLAHMRAKGGPARPCRYQVIIPIPAYIGNFIGNSVLETILNFPNSIYNDVSDAINAALGQSNGTATANPEITQYLALTCESAQLPGKSLVTSDVKIYGPTFKVPYQSVYDPVSLGFICTNEFLERKLFDRWLEAIMPTDTNNMRFPKDESSRYMTNIQIIQYDDFVRQIYAVELTDAFPTRIADQSLDWRDSGYHRLNVQFVYYKYKTIYDGSYNLGDIASSALGTVISRFLPQSI